MARKLSFVGWLCGAQLAEDKGGVMRAERAQIKAAENARNEQLKRDAAARHAAA